MPGWFRISLDVCLALIAVSRVRYPRLRAAKGPQRVLRNTCAPGARRQLLRVSYDGAEWRSAAGFPRGGAEGREHRSCHCGWQAGGEPTHSGCPPESREVEDAAYQETGGSG